MPVLVSCVSQMLNALRKKHLHLYRPLRLILDLNSLSSRKKKVWNNKLANRADTARKGPKDSQRRSHTSYKACKLYSVDMGTISAHFRGITKSERRGRLPKFTVQQEKVLLDLIFQLASWCFPLSIFEVIEMAGQYVLTVGLKETNLDAFLL